jgi:hypothetical protein
MLNSFFYKIKQLKMNLLTRRVRPMTPPNRSAMTNGRSDDTAFSSPEDLKVLFGKTPDQSFTVTNVQERRDAFMKFFESQSDR